jgi:antitoxin component of MazEF toxin-antitoxin module
MVKLLQRVGNSQAVLLSREQLDHLGATDAVTLTMEKGCIILRAATPEQTPPRRTRTVRQSLDSLNKKFPETLKMLSE